MACFHFRQYPNASKLDQCWVANDWLCGLGLSQYSAVFESQLVDGRLLNVLSKKDLDKYLNVHNKFHQSSILHGIQLLRMMRFDVQVCLSVVAGSGAYWAAWHLVGGVAQWLGRRSLAGELSLTCIRSMAGR